MHWHKAPVVQMDAAVAGPLFMLSAALLFTLLNLLIKLLSPAFTAWHIGFYRFTGGLVVLLAAFTRNQNPFQGNSTGLLIIRGCTGSVAFIALITAIRMLPVSTALVIFYAFPAFSAVFSFVIYNEQIGRFEIICIAVATLMDFEMAGGFIGPVMAFLASIFAGLTVTLIRSLREKNGPVIIYLYFCTMGALITLPRFLMDPVFPASPGEWMMISRIVLSSVMAQLLMNQGFFYCRGWEGGVFLSSEVIFTAAVGIVILDDPTSPRFWAGGVMIFCSIVALNRLKAVAKTD